MHARAALVHNLDAFKDILLFLRLKPWEPAEAMRLRRGLKLPERGNVEPLGQELGGFRSDPRDFQQLKDALGNRTREPRERCHGTRREIFVDLVGQIRADPGELLKTTRRSQTFEIAAVALQVLRRPATRSNAKRVVAAEFQQ